MVPEEIYEKYGMVPNIVFPTGALLKKNGRVDLYYGAPTPCAHAPRLTCRPFGAHLSPKSASSLWSALKENPILKPIEHHVGEKSACLTSRHRLGRHGAHFLSRHGRRQHLGTGLRRKQKRHQNYRRAAKSPPMYRARI
jgi:hypothetical protein